jgi:hypothetical protein
VVEVLVATLIKLNCYPHNCHQLMTHTLVPLWLKITLAYYASRFKTCELPGDKSSWNGKLWGDNKTDFAWERLQAIKMDKKDFFLLLEN